MSHRLGTPRTATVDRRADRSRNVLLILAVLAVLLGGLGILVAVEPGLFGISTACPGCIIPIWWVYGLLLAGSGGLLALVALILAVVDAVRRGDKASVILIALLFFLNFGGEAYLGAAVGATLGPGGRSAGAPSLTLLPLLLVAAALASPPVTALLYALLRDRRGPRLGALGGQAALLVLAVLIVAPPWVAFNPANGAPVLAVSAPNVTVNCATGQYPPITLKNSGRGTLRWTSFAAFNAVTINPARGALGPGATQAVTLSGAYTPSPDRPQEVGVEFDSNGGSQRVTYACQSAAGATPSP